MQGWVIFKLTGEYIIYGVAMPIQAEELKQRVGKQSFENLIEVISVAWVIVAIVYEG